MESEHILEMRVRKMDEIRQHNEHQDDQQLWFEKNRISVHPKPSNFLTKNLIGR